MLLIVDSFISSSVWKNKDFETCFSLTSLTCITVDIAWLAFAFLIWQKYNFQCILCLICLKIKYIDLDNEYISKSEQSENSYVQGILGLMV